MDSRYQNLAFVRQNLEFRDQILRMRSETGWLRGRSEGSALKNQAHSMQCDHPAVRTEINSMEFDHLAVDFKAHALFSEAGFDEI